MIRRLAIAAACTAFLVGATTLPAVATVAPSATPSKTSASKPNWRPIEPRRVKFISQIETTDKVFFITIDDGITKNPNVAQWVKHTKTPVTAFLSENVTGPSSAQFFNDVTRYGSVQNHTANHASLTSSSTDIHAQVCSIQSTYRSRYGERPWMLRPPYGNGGWNSSPAYQRSAIADVVGPCGIKYVVNWFALVDNNGNFQSQNGTGTISAGDIVLLHFVPGLRDQLAALVERGKASGLRPANLADYLPQP